MKTRSCYDISIQNRCLTSWLRAKARVLQWSVKALLDRTLHSLSYPISLKLFSLFHNSLLFVPQTSPDPPPFHYNVLHITVCGENPFPHILVRDCTRDKIQVHVWLPPNQILTTIHGPLVKFLSPSFFHTPSNICINTMVPNEILKLKTPSCTKLSNNLENSWWLLMYLLPKSNFQPLLTKNRYAIGQKGCHIITSGSSIQKVFLNIYFGINTGQTLEVHRCIKYSFS